MHLRVFLQMQEASPNDAPTSKVWLVESVLAESGCVYSCSCPAAKDYNGMHTLEYPGCRHIVYVQKEIGEFGRLVTPRGNVEVRAVRVSEHGILLTIHLTIPHTCIRRTCLFRVRLQKR